MFADAYRGKRVFMTGHTGFKGSWLCLWLERLGAEVHGFALAPPTGLSLFEQAGVVGAVDHTIGDIRDGAALSAALAKARPHFIFHLAAQPLVLDSYTDPAGTFATNVTGSINLMEAIRQTGTHAAVVMVTTDKVYLNRECDHAYREDDPLGGHDPYSASKAAMEIAVSSWRDSFFSPAKVSEHGVQIATARAGNVIGGGDWSVGRLVPDLVRALGGNQAPTLRSPGSLRPWQHVLEPLAGYLWLGARLAEPGGESFAEGWNFGPLASEEYCVGDLANAFLAAWGRPGWSDVTRSDAPHEAGLLKLNIDKARERLDWRPVWPFAETVARTAQWYRGVSQAPDTARAACLTDLDHYCAQAKALGLPFVA